jgi:hypothetical protein
MHHDSAARRTKDAGVIGKLLRTSVKHRATQKPVTHHDHHSIDHHQQQH